ncbi:MAG: excalibur calcium-binding domain-containing protein [Coleofasciculus sp. C2-GNP5-27]
MTSFLISAGLILALVTVQCHSPTNPPSSATEETDVPVSIYETPPTHQTDQTVESLSPEPIETRGENGTENLPECVNRDCNCSDFTQQKDAQRVLEQFPDDPHGLDKNNDGVACESLL